MRPLECLLIAVLALSLAWLALGAKGPPKLRYLLLAAPLLALIQALAEGFRWQMAPADLAAVLLPLALPAGRRTWIALAGLCALLAALAAALGLAIPVRPLPPPPGPYAIGTRLYDWRDDSRPEPFTADPADHREVMAQVWYPAAPGSREPLAPYVADARTVAPLARLLKLPDFMLSHLSLIRTNARLGAPAAAGRFPVVVFAHGRGGWRGHNSQQIEALVLRGYVVVALDHAYGAAGTVFANGRLAAFDPRMMDRRFEDRMMPVFAADTAFALDRMAALDRQGPLAGRLDTSRAGIFGLSMGGIVAAESCRTNPRFKACLIIDVDLPADVTRQGLAQPAFYMARDLASMRREGWPEGISRLTYDTNAVAFARNGGPAWRLLLTGAFHTDFSDQPLLCARPVCRWLGLSGPIGEGRTAAIAEAYEAAFFDRWLKGLPAPLLDRPPPFPEARLDRRG